MTYDSRADTLIHSQRVGVLLTGIIERLMTRAVSHDRSKTQSPEVEVFDEFTPRLQSMEYGSEEYKACLEAMGEGLRHHYEANRHHPEHFENGVSGMTLIDVTEMLADWKAATERVKNGDLGRSLEIQKERFGLSDDLYSILKNTASVMGWLSPE